MKKKDAQGRAAPANQPHIEGRPEAGGRVDGERANADLSSGSGSAPEPTAIISPTEVLPMRPGQDPESVTEAIEFGGDGGKPTGTRSDYSVLKGQGLLDSLPTKTTDIGREDTEEVFVILPDEEGSLPTVETVEVEDPAWEGTGPTTTDVLKDLPPAVPPAPPSSLEDVPLMKVNPLSGPEAAPTSQPAETETIDGLAGEISQPEKAEGEEIGAIDEIADLAADLDREGPIEAGLDEQNRPTEPVLAAGGPERSGASRKVRFLATFASLAALVLLGVFFYPEIQKLIFGEESGGRRVATAGGVGAGVPVQGHASPGATDPDGAAVSERAASRDAFRSKILLAVEYGLRAEAGKD